MSEGNLLQSYNYETNNFEETLNDYVGSATYEDPEVQFPRPVSDEVISVYEVYVKEESEDPSIGRNDPSVMQSLPPTNDHHQLLQGGSGHMDSNIDRMKVDNGVSKFLGKDAVKYKMLEQCISPRDRNVVVYSHAIPEGSSQSSARLVDKDDPRSRLHFVKYLKRDGKTLKIWECGICSKEFRHQYTLMRHLPTHTDERNFKCDACGKAFRQLSTLSQHKAIHSDARPYVCEFCKKTFNRVSTLISHRKTHSEHKPHKCHLCGKGFHQKGNLRNHVFTHTNERPYKCELCGKGFNQMSNLVCHKVKAHAHTEKMQYSCTVCGKEFPRRFSLRSHEEYKHGIKYRQPIAQQTGIGDQNVIRNKNVRIVQLPSEEGNHQMPEIRDNHLINTILNSTGPEDLRVPEKMNLNPSGTTDVDESMKTVQIRMPMVGPNIQKLEQDEKPRFIMEPGPEPHQNVGVPLDAHFSYSEHMENEQHRAADPTAPPSIEECNELLELAAQGGIQFVRATEDGRYERRPMNHMADNIYQSGMKLIDVSYWEHGHKWVMSNSEARDLMAQNSHDMAILNSEDALNVVNLHHNNNEVIIGDSDNQIMVLNSGTTRKPMPIDGIEILEDKDIRILESKTMDDRFMDGIGFLPYPKTDDFVLGPRSLGIEHVNIPVTEHDEGLSMMTNHQDYSTLLNHRNDMPTLSNPHSTIPAIPTIYRNHPPPAMMTNSLPYIKTDQNMPENMNILNTGTQESLDYDTKIKLPMVFDETDPGIPPPMNQQDIKILGPGNQNAKIVGDNMYLPPLPKLYPNFGEVKILGPKNHSQEMIMTQFQDMKMFNPYDDFKNSVSSFNTSNENANNSGRKEVKILGKKLGTGIFTGTDEENVKILDEKRKTEPLKELCNNADNTLTSSPHLDKYKLNAENMDQDPFSFQLKRFENIYCHQSVEKENSAPTYTELQPAHR